MSVRPWLSLSRGSHILQSCSVLKAPILDWQPPHDMYTLKAKDVMNKPPVCFFLTERVGDVFQVNPILFLLSVCLCAWTTHMFLI